MAVVVASAQVPTNVVFDTGEICLVLIPVQVPVLIIVLPLVQL